MHDQRTEVLRNKSPYCIHFFIRSQRREPCSSSILAAVVFPNGTENPLSVGHCHIVLDDIGWYWMVLNGFGFTAQMFGLFGISDFTFTVEGIWKNTFGTHHLLTIYCVSPTTYYVACMTYLHHDSHIP